MPRSGSTLLQNILAQNPSIKSSPTSVLGELVGGLLNQIQQSASVKACGYSNVIPHFKELVKGGIASWHSSQLSGTKATTYIDKSRSYLFQKNLLQDIYGDDFKIICIVRDLKDVIASMEKNHRKNIYRSDHIQGSGATNLTQRINGYLSSSPINPTLSKVVDLIQCGDTRNIVFIRYENLLNDPQTVMDRLYAAVGLPSFAHDFSNIKQSTHEDDEFHGIYGQHKIKPQLCNPNAGISLFNEETNRFINENNQIFQSFFGYML